MTKHTKWQASWIWSAGEESPRNEWRCFRKRFQTNVDNCAGATIKITADSRYVLYVNGQRVGRGPVRSWPFELAYDEYEIGHLLKPDAENSIAVLVLHFGVSTFYYLRGRGGLLVQVEAGSEGSRSVVAATDSSWTTAVHAGHDARAQRMSCQHAFAEIVDARAWDESWTEAEYADADWERATVIGPVGMEPWVKLVPNDIPHLTEEPMYPVRVESLRRVTPVAWNAALELRNQFAPGSEDHANIVELAGYLATTIRVAQPAMATIAIVDDGRLFGPLSVNGVWHERNEWRTEDDVHRLDVALAQGDNFVLFDVSGNTHGHAYHLAIDSDAPFEVVAPPIGGTAPVEAETPFVTIGPFASRVVIDHRKEPPIDRADPDFVRARAIASAADLATFRSWVKPVPASFVNLQGVYGSLVWTKRAVPLAVPHALQHAVIASCDAAVVPSFGEEHTELVIDFGRELSGYLAFEVDAGAGTVIDLYGFEYMRDGWRQDTNGLDNTLRYVCREGRQTYTSPVRRGLRYLMVTVRGAEKPLRIVRLQLLQSNYPIAEIGRFHSSDPLLNDIWSISKHTTRLCMEDTFVDCPAFEQTFWVGDARNEALVNYYLFGDDAIVKRCLRLVPGSKFQTPLYVDQVPSGWSSVIPNWTFFWAIACLELYRWNGDRQFAADIWPHVHDTLDHYLDKLDERGLFDNVGWNMLDWAPIDQPNDGIVTHQNMFLVRALRCAAELATSVGSDAGGRYIAAADGLAAAINAHLWSDEREAYVDCIHADGAVSTTFSMQTQTVAYLCDIAAGERLARMEAMLLNPPAAFVPIGSPFMSFFYYEALVKLGRFDVMLADMRKQYGQMIDHDATTCWEMYPQSSGGGRSSKLLTRSHCHAWSAGPAFFLGAYVLGVRGRDPGWSQVVVAPQSVGLAWARGTVPLPGRGRIDVSWRLEPDGNKMHIRVEAPADIELSVEPPAHLEATVELVRLGA